jgi:hypothetical protein
MRARATKITRFLAAVNIYIYGHRRPHQWTNFISWCERFVL